MNLSFNIDKAIAAAAYIIERDGGSSNMFPLIKILYYSDRSALIEWGNSVTGDALASLRKGPIVSTIYDLLKGDGSPQDQAEWDLVIERRGEWNVVAKRSPGTEVLSEREIQILEKSRLKINSIRGSIADWLHINCPEWEDPGASSKPIDPGTILRLANKNDEDIRLLEEANTEISYMKALLRAG